MVCFYQAGRYEYPDLLPAELYSLLHLQDVAGKLPAAAGVAQRGYRADQIGSVRPADRLADGVAGEGEDQVVGVE